MSDAKSFSEIENSYGLRKFLPSQLGDLYISPERKEKSLLRKFKDLKNVTLFLEVSSKSENWLSLNGFDELIGIARPIEVGIDYILREFYLYNTSLEDIFDEEYTSSIPSGLIEIQSKLKKELASDKNINPIVQRVLFKSLIENSPKTYYEYNSDFLFVVEFIIDSDDLARWEKSK